MPSAFPIPGFVDSYFLIVFFYGGNMAIGQRVGLAIQRSLILVLTTASICFTVD